MKSIFYAKYKKNTFLKVKRDLFLTKKYFPFVNFLIINKYLKNNF